MNLLRIWIGATLWASKVIKPLHLHAKKVAFIVEHDFIMATYLADKVVVYSGTPAIEATAHAPQSLLTGMNSFLKAPDYVPSRSDQLPPAHQQVPVAARQRTKGEQLLLFARRIGGRVLFHPRFSYIAVRLDFCDMVHLVTCSSIVVQFISTSVCHISFGRHVACRLVELSILTCRALASNLVCASSSARVNISPSEVEESRSPHDGIVLHAKHGELVLEFFVHMLHVSRVVSHRFVFTRRLSGIFAHRRGRFDDEIVDVQRRIFALLELVVQHERLTVYDSSGELGVDVTHGVHVRAQSLALFLCLDRRLRGVFQFLQARREKIVSRRERTSPPFLTPVRSPP